jgi:flagellar biosynthetic protein FlhB
VIASISTLVAAVWFRAALAMLVLGILDFGYQYWQYQQDLRMSVQEAKEEAQQLEGNPRIKQRIRQIQRQMAMRRMMADVPKADVIITNPVTYAVALRYDMDTMDAPLVIAKGARLLAKRIREIGEENDVPIVEKPDLARALYKNIDVGKPVPENLFRAVAEVLSFVYKIDRREEKRRERERTMASLAPAH